MNGVDRATTVQVPAALDHASSAAFLAAVTAAHASDRSVVLLEGSDGVFCRGLDVQRAVTVASRDLRTFADALLALRRSPKPVVAAIDGCAFGGGLGIAAAADVVLATERSTFALPEAQLGLAPAIIMPFLLERMRLQECRLWALSSYSRSADQAAAAGLVDVLTLGAELADRTRYWVRQLARAHPAGVMHVKRLTSWGQHHLERSVEEGLALTADLLNRRAAILSGDDGE